MVCPPVFGRTFPFPGKPNWLAAAIGLLVVSGWAGSLRAGTIPVPNASFESPVTEFVDTRIDSWQETPRPFWFEETPQNQWDFTTGVFKNTDPDKLDHIDNLDGSQAMYLFAVPDVGLFQDYDSTDWAHPTPPHVFDARFEVDTAYRLTVGVVGTGPLAQGASLLVGLYYRDSASNRVTVAATHIVYTNTVFSNATHLLDFQVNVPPVKAADPWAGQHIGVQMLSTVGFDLQGGYWDLDNVRLTAIRPPVLRNAALTSGQFSFTLESDPGLRFEILASTDPGLPSADWTRLGAVTNVTGSVLFTDPTAASSRRFYGAREWP